MRNMFEDPRSHEAGDLTFQGELLERRGDLAGAREVYRRAAPLDESLARDTPFTSPRVRIVLAISAVSLWAAAGELQRAVDLADEFLSDPTPRCNEHPNLERLAAEYRALLSHPSPRPHAAPDAPRPAR